MKKHTQTDKRYWLATANSDKCRHADALHEIGFINWVMGKKFHFKVGDIVYLFMKNERKVRFQLKVVGEYCQREDQAFWAIQAPDDKTYKLELQNEYEGNSLNEERLRKYGFNGGTQNPTYKNKKLMDYITSIFEPKNDDIIDFVIPENQWRTRDNVRKMIPILIHWAKTGRRDGVYGDLINAIGKVKFGGIGHSLYAVQKVLDELASRSGSAIPTLNSLCKNAKTMLPSEGFDYVIEKYNELDDKAKRVFIDGLDSQAVSYQRWDWVLKELGLQEIRPFTEEDIEKIKHPNCFGGGEGKEHKDLKEFIFQHPESVGLKNVVFKEIEHELPSGDRLDIYFELSDRTHIAVEVKPSISLDSDISRGIFQCVKYSAVMDALRIIECAEYNIKTLLITSRKLTARLEMLAGELDVDYIDCLIVK